MSADTEAQITFVLRSFTSKNAVAKVLSATLSYQCFGDLAEDPDRIRKPDVTVVKTERLEALLDSNPGVMTIIPDLAIEVISTNDLFAKMDQKLLDYRSLVSRWCGWLIRLPG